METIEKQTYTVKEAAVVLGISASTLYEAIQHGNFPALHIGRSIRVARAAVEHALSGELPPRIPRAGRSVRGTDEDADDWAERQARELEVRARLTGGELY